MFSKTSLNDQQQQHVHIGFQYTSELWSWSFLIDVSIIIYLCVCVVGVLWVTTPSSYYLFQSHFKYKHICNPGLETAFINKRPIPLCIVIVIRKYNFSILRFCISGHNKKKTNRVNSRSQNYVNTTSDEKNNILHCYYLFNKNWVKMQKHWAKKHTSTSLLLPQEWRGK